MAGRWDHGKNVVVEVPFAREYHLELNNKYRQ